MVASTVPQRDAACSKLVAKPGMRSSQHVIGKGCSNHTVAARSLGFIERMVGPCQRLLDPGVLSVAFRDADADREAEFRSGRIGVEAQFRYPPPDAVGHQHRLIPGG